MKILFSMVIPVFRRHRYPLLFLLSTWGTYFVVLFPRLFSFDSEALYIGHEHAWSDWPLHMAMASTFAYQSPEHWFTHHPMYAYGGLKYTFLVNFFAGMLMRLGFSIYAAFTLPAIVYALLLLVGMYALFYLLLQSQKQAITAIFLFLLSSGLGFIDFIRNFIDAPSFEQLWHPVQMYSRVDEYTWVSGNIVSGFLVPQRSFLLGFTLAIWALVGFLYVMTHDGNRRRHRLILGLAGGLAGILPLAHMHSFLAILVIAAPLCYVSSLLHKTSFDWLYFAVPAGVIAVTVYTIFLAGGVSTSKFLTYYPGWNAKGGLLGWIVMWLRLWGITLPVALVGLWLMRKRSALIQTFFFGFWAIFILANLFLFQPITWDNSKLFFWAYFGFCGLGAVTLAWLWRNRFRYLGRLDVIFLSLVLTFTGMLEAIRLQRTDLNRMHLVNRADIALGQQIRLATAPTSVFLTAPSNNHVIMTWANRPILIGFVGWLPNFGFDYSQRLADIETMFQGGAIADQLLKQYRVSYVAIGPGELNEFHAHEAYFSQHYPVAFKNDSYRIYDVRSLTQ